MDELDMQEADWGLADDATPAVTTGYGRIITQEAFRMRLTADEWAEIELASEPEPGASREARKLAAKIATWSRDIGVMSRINLDMPRVRAGLELLESSAVIVAGRAREVLDAEVRLDEVPAEIRARMGWG